MNLNLDGLIDTYLSKDVADIASTQHLIGWSTLILNAFNNKDDVIKWSNEQKFGKIFKNLIPEGPIKLSQ